MMALQFGGDVNGFPSMLVYPNMPDAPIWEEPNEAKDDDDEDDDADE